MYIGVCGFTWSGSGAVIDYLLEFEKMQISNDEFLLAYHPDGILDLDYNINTNCAKFLSSSVAIPRFRKLTEFLFKHKTKGKITELTNNYLSSIIQSKWIGDGQGQVLLHNQWIYGAIGGRIKKYYIYKQSRKKIAQMHIYPMAEMSLSVCPDDFLQKTQDYIDSIFEALGYNTDQTIVVNQPFPGNNPLPSMKYFKDSKAIVVDRDPRDLYIFMRVVNPGGSYSIPVMDVKSFVEYYRSLRKPLKLYNSQNNILFIKFEDMVYNYGETSKKIREFLCLGMPISPRHYFVPEMSMTNTQLFRRHHEFKEELAYIAKELPEYLFDFDSYEYNPSSNVMFDDNPLTADVLIN